MSRGTLVCACLFPLANLPASCQNQANVCMATKPLPRPATLRDVARVAGVAPSTVSRAFNWRKGLVTTETRDRILRAAERLNYVPNLLASGLKTTRSYTVGAVLTSFMNPFFAAVARGIQDAATAEGKEVFFCNTDDDPQREADAIEALVSRRVDGLIAATSGRDAEPYKKLLGRNYPLVLIDRLIPGLHCDAAVAENVLPTQEAVRKLADLGHRRIALLTPPTAGVSARQARVEAFRAATKSPDPALVLEIPASVAESAAAAGRLLKLKPPPTAFCVLNPQIAIGMLQQLRAAGLRVPEDVSVILLDDTEWAALMSPPLSGIRQPAYDLGMRANQLLSARLEEPEKPVETTYLAAEWIERGSAGPARPQRS